MSSKQNPRERLSRIASQLRELSLPTATVPVEDATFLADAIQRYLAGKAPSMDHALGLTRGRGPPSDPEVAKRNVEIAHAVLQEILKGAPATNFAGTESELMCARKGIANQEHGAFAVVAGRYAVSESTVRNAYYDEQAMTGAMAAEIAARVNAQVEAQLQAQREARIKAGWGLST